MKKVEFCIVRTTTGNSGAKYRSFLAGDGMHEKFKKSGDSVTGVGVGGLRTWQTRAAAERNIAKRTHYDSMPLTVEEVDT